MGMNVTAGKTLLIVAYAFPPIPYAGTYRMLRLCKRLAKTDLKIHVLTINIYNDIPNDFELLGQVPPNVTIHRTPIIDPWRRYQSVKNRWANLKGGSVINRAASFILKFLSVPDHMVMWIPFAFLKGWNILRKHNVDTVMVSSPPVSSLLIGYLLKKARKVRLLSDLRDPIVDNVFEVSLIRPKGVFTKFEKGVRVFLEKLIIRNSDIVITTTQTYKKELYKKYKTEKFVSILNSYDEDDYENVPRTKQDLFTISHVGSIAGLRRVDVLFEAIRRLEKRMHPEILRLQVQFIGMNSPKLMEDVKSYGVEPFVKIAGLVSHKEAIRVLANSHMLLLVKELNGVGMAQIPAKFYEYIGAGKKILFLGPSDHEVSKWIKDYELGYVIENETEEATNILWNEYRWYVSNTEGLRTSDDALQVFSSRTMATHFHSLLYEKT